MTAGRLELEMVARESVLTETAHSSSNINAKVNPQVQFKEFKMSVPKDEGFKFLNTKTDGKSPLPRSLGASSEGATGVGLGRVAGNKMPRHRIHRVGLFSVSSLFGPGLVKKERLGRKKERERLEHMCRGSFLRGRKGNCII